MCSGCMVLSAGGKIQSTYAGKAGDYGTSGITGSVGYSRRQIMNSVTNNNYGGEK